VRAIRLSSENPRRTRRPASAPSRARQSGPGTLGGYRNVVPGEYVSVTMRKITVLLALGSGLALVPPASAAASDRLPTLLAKAKVQATGRTLAKRVELRLLDPHAFRVSGRASASSVTLGWPAAHPCALTTLRLTLLPDQSDAAAVAEAVVPTADATGTANRIGKVALDGTRPAFAGVWRQRSESVQSSILRVHAVAATPLLDRYGDPAGGLLELRLDAHTIRGNNRCSGPNVFRIGPNLIDTIIISA
jgi:hypothetical protein